MESKAAVITILIVLLSSLFGFGTCNIDQDKQKCSSQLVAVATCLPFVSGQSNAPPVDCCTGFKQVLDKSRECICLLIKDRDDPSLGLKINITRALSLPAKCNAPANQRVADCPAILHLPPNSSDAKVFQGLDNSSTTTSAGNSTSSPKGAAASSSVNTKSDGGKRMETIESFSLIVLMTLVTYISCVQYLIYYY